MKRYLTILLTFSLLSLSSILHAQLQFELVTDKTTYAVGDTVELQVQTVGFSNIFGYIMDLQYDNEVFEIVLNQNNQPVIIPDRYDPNGSFLFNEEIEPNRFRLLVNATDPFTFADGKVLWTARLVAKAAKNSASFSIVDCGATCDYAFADENGESTSGGTLSAVNNGVVVDVTSDGGGGTPVERATLYTTNSQATRGEEVCLDVKAQDMPPVLGFEGTFSWNPDSLVFRQVTNVNSTLPGFSATTSFGGTTSSGLMTLSYSNLSSTTPTELPQDVTLFTVCFTANGSDKLEFDDSGNSGPRWAIFGEESAELPKPTLSSTGGNVSISEPVAGAPTIDAGEVMVPSGGSVCVPISVRDFNNIESFSVNYQYDVNAFSFDSISVSVSSEQIPNFQLGGNTIRINQETGVVSLLYFETSVSLPDDTKLIDICLTANGSGGEYDVLVFNDSNLPNEISTGEGIVNANFLPGSITISSTPLTIDETNSGQTNVSCNGGSDGSASLAASGGSGSYTYDWAHIGGTSNAQQATGLSAGQYSVTISDGTNNVSRTFTITEPDALDFSSQTSNPTAVGNNGSIRLNPIGGTPNYTYNWSTGATTQEITGLSAGTYSFTITDANNCTLSDDIVLNGPLLASISPDDPSCFGGSDGTATVAVTGGSAPYTFAWSNGQTTRTATGLSAGAVSVTVTDANNQTNSASNTLVAPTQITITDAVTNATDAEPNSGAIVLTVSGGTPNYTFNWSNGAATRDIDGIPAGNYSVTVTDANGCQRIEENIAVSETVVSQVQVVGVNVFDPIDCAGDDDAKARVTVTPAGGDYTFTWSGLPAGNNTTTTREVSGLPSGTQTVTVRDNLTDREASFTFEVTEPAPLSATFDSETAPSSVGVNDGSANLSIMGGTEPYQVTWNQDCDGTGVVTCDRLRAGENQILIVDANSCRITPTVMIPVPSDANCDDHRPVITPNGDGKNETLEFFCDVTGNNTLEVYNRWGELVYFQENYDNTWEGTDSGGQRLIPGAYFYVFTVTSASGQETQYKGHVTILREF